MGDITQEREKGRSASAQDGAGMCTTPMSQPLMQPSHALPTNLLRNRTHWLRRRKHDTGEWNVAGTHDAGEDTMSAGAQDGSVLCTTPMPHLLRQPSHALPTKPIAQQYLLAGTKEARHGREACCGRHYPRERERKVSKCTRWDRSVHHTHAIALTQPTHAWPTKVVHNRTHQLRQKKHDTGEWNVAGTHDAGEKKMQHVHKMGQLCAPHPCLISSRNR